MIDSHLHFDSFEKEGETDAIVARALEAGVRQMIAIGGSPSANQLAADLSARYPGVIGCTLGYDRDEIGQDPRRDELMEMVQNSNPNGIGEAGLDYHYLPESALEQRELFALNLSVAAEAQLPIIIHSRDADEDTLAMLKEHAASFNGPPERLGVLHCFTGSAGFARKLLDLGFYISFSGIVTFKNAADIRAAAAIVPSDRLLVETDAPYLAPVPYRGKRNEPAYVRQVVETLAEIHSDTFTSMVDITAANARILFGLEPE